MVRLELTDQAITFIGQHLAIGRQRDDRRGCRHPRGSETAGQNGRVTRQVLGPHLQAVAIGIEALQHPLGNRQAPLAGISTITAGDQRLAIDHHRDGQARLQACCRATQGDGIGIGIGGR